MGSTKIRSRTLPWPPVILAIISLPQIINPVPAPISSRRIIMIVLVIILRFLDIGFLTFFCFLDGSEWASEAVDVCWVVVRLSLSLSKSKA